MCAPPTVIDSFHFSAPGKKQSPHGDKLYKFFVKDVKSYQDTAVKQQPFGQALVKETWKVKEVRKEEVIKYKFINQILNFLQREYPNLVLHRYHKANC